MNTPEELRKTIEEGIRSNLNFHTPDYDFMLQKLWEVLFDATSALRGVVDEIQTDKLPEKEFACMLILTNCLVDAHASYQAMREGFHRAAAITARGMLENMALAIAMKGDESDSVFKKYKDGKLDIPWTITPAKAHFPEVGVLYGVLSNTFAHEPYESIGRAFVQQGKTTVLLLVPPVGREDFLIQFTLCVNLAMLISTMGQVFEWCFANFIDSKIFWERVGEGKLNRKPAPSFDAINEMGKKYETKLNQRLPQYPSVKKPGSM